MENRITPKEAVELLKQHGIKVQPDTIRRWAAGGHLPGTLIVRGRLWLRPADILAMARGTPAPAQTGVIDPFTLSEAEQKARYPALWAIGTFKK